MVPILRHSPWIWTWFSTSDSLVPTVAPIRYQLQDYRMAKSSKVSSTWKKRVNAEYNRLKLEREPRQLVRNWLDEWYTSPFWRQGLGILAKDPMIVISDLATKFHDVGTWKRVFSRRWRNESIWSLSNLATLFCYISKSLAVRLLLD